MQVLHRLRRFVESDLEVCPGVTLGLPPETLRTVLADPLAPGESLHAYLGHAGWGAGQLDAEMEQGSWILCSGDARVVFETPFERAWDRVLESLGPRYADLAHYPADPRLN
jgi:putative transcriptional regulator